MGTLSKSCLLFALNWLDAQLTLLWIHLNVATEGNSLMAQILDHGAVYLSGCQASLSAALRLTFSTVVLTCRSPNMV